MLEAGSGLCFFMLCLNITSRGRPDTAAVLFAVGSVLDVMQLDVGCSMQQMRNAMQAGRV